VAAGGSSGLGLRPIVVLSRCPQTVEPGPAEHVGDLLHGVLADVVEPLGVMT